MSTTATWGDPSDCPFCGSELPNPGAGFIDHIEENPDCEDGFETWRSNINDDICAGWSG